MVVQHNMQAANANRMLGTTVDSLSKSTEKLSSGYRINRAADDAAGLSISEKMRKQIRGLDQASTNAQDGVSAVQTAEGALTEVHSMLQRMNELAVQSSNGTNSESDRKAIQDEINQLTTEIDRVAETTKFNETYLLKGDDNKTQITNKVYSKPQTFLLEDVMAKGSTFALTTEMDKDGKSKYTFTTGLAVGSTWNGKEVVADDAGEGQIALDDAKTEEIAAMQNIVDKYFAEMGLAAGVTIADGELEVTSASKDFVYNDSLNLSLHVGADSSSNNKISLNIESMSAAYLGVEGLKVDGKTAAQATAAIDIIANAVTKVSSQRSALGAVQNRLEHTIANVDNVVENTTAAESRIRDVDMAEEMVIILKEQHLTAGWSVNACSGKSGKPGCSFFITVISL